MLWIVHKSCSRLMLSLQTVFKTDNIIYKPIIREHRTEFNDIDAHNISSWSRYSKLHAQTHHITTTSYQQHNPIKRRFSSFTQNTRWWLMDHVFFPIFSKSLNHPWNDLIHTILDCCTSAHHLLSLSQYFTIQYSSLFFLLLNNQITTHFLSHSPIRFFYPFFIYHQWTRANE